MSNSVHEKERKYATFKFVCYGCGKIFDVDKIKEDVEYQDEYLTRSVYRCPYCNSTNVHKEIVTV